MSELLKTILNQLWKKDVVQTPQPEVHKLSESQNESIILYLRKICPKGFPIGVGLRGDFNPKRVAHDLDPSISELPNNFSIPKGGEVSVEVEQFDTHLSDGKKEFVSERFNRTVWTDDSKRPGIVVISDEPIGLSSDAFTRTYVLATEDMLGKLLRLS